jgi:hypothetical protein
MNVLWNGGALAVVEPVWVKIGRKKWLLVFYRSDTDHFQILPIPLPSAKNVWMRV